MNKNFMRQAQQLQKQVTKMQEDLANAQKELETEEVEASSGGGVVTVVITGKLKIKSINIEPEATEEIEMLQDLVTAAVNEAIETAQKMAESRLSSITGGMNIPGLPGLM
ncbi:MAG: YbaB/EbfC family nucleoid-associated protein [Dehalococcoidia bacterium]|nr:YbaB/EbfC family nucleoid-associated protein [Dehalococcoidia bacterium]|tara:strand:+ start:332 stop:661 length:330 start_codon:yes stop_codon:yes gene_type:complete